MWIYNLVKSDILLAIHDFFIPIFERSWYKRGYNYKCVAALYMCQIYACSNILTRHYCLLYYCWWCNELYKHVCRGTSWSKTYDMVVVHMCFWVIYLNNLFENFVNMKTLSVLFEKSRKYEKPIRFLCMPFFNSELEISIPCNFTPIESPNDGIAMA